MSDSVDIVHQANAAVQEECCLFHKNSSTGLLNISFKIHIL